MTSNLRQRWEQRAASKSNTCEGVLFQGLPSELNLYLHERHVQVLSEQFLPLLPPGARLLDLGCGYGRIGSVVRDHRSDIELIGADFAVTYCAAFKKKTAAPAVGAELMRLPFRPSVFDALVAVTVLMYVPLDQRASALAALAGLIKPGGYMLLVDPGAEFQRMVAVLKPTAARKTTGGMGFEKHAMTELARLGGLELVACGGMPWGSLALPVLYGLIKLGLPSKGLMRWLGRQDDAHRGSSRWSIHRWMVLRRRSDEGVVRR